MEDVRVIMDKQFVMNDWRQFKVYARAGSGYAISYQSGCSCNYWIEPDYSELTWFIGRDVLYAKIAEIIDEMNEYREWCDAAKSAEIKSEIRRAI